MPVVVFMHENEYDPLNMEPYKTFNEKFEARKECIDGTVIKIGIPERKKRGFADGFTQDQYCHDMMLLFSFSKLGNASAGEDEIIVHHELYYEYSFDAYNESQFDMATEFKQRDGYFYLPNVKNLEIRFQHDPPRKVTMVFDAVTDFRHIKEVSNLLISHDIAIFARGV